MNAIADLKADSLRTLFIYIVPGAIALLPWCCFFLHEVHAATTYMSSDSHQSVVVIVLLVACLTTGKFLDGLGTYWEVHVNDARLAKGEFPNFAEDWSRYIRTAFVHAPVAVDYINNLTQTLKFELNLGFAFLVFAIGQVPLAYVLKHYSSCQATWVVLGALAAAVVSFASSCGTSRVLASVRKWLRDGVIVDGELAARDDAG